MKWRNILLCLLLASFALHAQRRKATRRPVPAGCDYGCTYHNLFSREQREQRFPFSRAHNILVISFAAWPEEAASSGTMSCDTFGHAAVHEVRSLSGPLRDSLSGILFNRLPANYFLPYKNCVTVEGEASCYEPRHAILFLDADGKMFEQIEMCFHCAGFRYLPDPVNTGVICTGRLEQLEQIVRASGIRYGLDRH